MLFDLDEFLNDKKTTVTFNNRYSSIYACLESLGVGAYLTPVILPALTPSRVVSSVLRAGGTPIILDVSKSHGQQEPEDLEKIIKSLNTTIPVMYFGVYGNSFADPELIQLTKGFPSIVEYYDVVVNKDTVESTMVGTFNVLTAPDGCSSVVQEFEDNTKVLREVRDGILGVSSSPSKAQEMYIQSNYEDIINSISTPNISNELYYNNEKTAFAIHPVLRTRVKYLLGDPCVKGLPIGEVISSKEEILNRFPEVPSYPIAEFLTKNVFKLQGENHE